MNHADFFLATDQHTQALGEALARLLDRQQPAGQPSLTVFLLGELGAGKTTLMRGFLRHHGHHGKVKSPTYTLVEPYQLKDRLVYHFDLYRLADPEELDFIGIRDYLTQPSICVFEWPQKGGDYLPIPDVTVQLNYEEEARRALIESSFSLDKLLEQ